MPHLKMQNANISGPDTVWNILELQQMGHFTRIHLSKHCPAWSSSGFT